MNKPRIHHTIGQPFKSLFHLAYNICYNLSKEGNGAAMYHMVNYHESGLGVSKDRETAMELYRRAVEAAGESSGVLR